jgi:hypothetical protein
MHQQKCGSLIKTGEVMSKVSRIAAIGFMVLSLGACSLAAPKYNASMGNVEKLRDAELGKVKIGKFTADPTSKSNVNRLTIRGSSYESPYDKSFVAYLEEAVRQEIDDGRLLDTGANTEIDGVLIRNELDGSGISIGTADIEARFLVKRDGTVRYDKVQSAHHEWESSFVGAKAVPSAAQNYPIVVQKLLAKHFGDSEFRTALKP